MAASSLLSRSRAGLVQARFRSATLRTTIPLFVCVVLLCCFCDYVLPSSVGLACAGIIYGFWSVWLAVLESRSTALQCNPLVTYQLWQAGTLGLSPLYITLNYSAGDALPLGSRLVGLDQVAHGHAILAVGALTLYAGMKQFQPKEKIARKGTMRETSQLELLTYFSAGALVLIFVRQIGLVVGSALAGLSTMPLAALSLFALNFSPKLRRSKLVYWTVLAVGTITLLLLYARGDSKMMLSFSFAPIALAALRRMRVGSLIIFGIGFAAIYLLMIVPLVALMRTTVRRDENGERSLFAAQGADVRGKLQQKFRDDPELYAKTSLDNTMLRLSDSVPAGFIDGSVSSYGLLYGEGMSYVPTTFVPRLLWHDKPMIDPGRYFTVALGGASDVSVVTTSTGQTSAGELFWNFGWPGVILGMYLLGAAISMVHWRAGGGNPTVGVLEMTAFIGVTLSFVLTIGGAAGATFVGAISNGIVLRLLIQVRDRISLRGRKRGRHLGIAR
jgi:hypothetical protein